METSGREANDKLEQKKEWSISTIPRLSFRNSDRKLKRNIQQKKNDSLEGFVLLLKMSQSIWKQKKFEIEFWITMSVV